MLVLKVLGLVVVSATAIFRRVERGARKKTAAARYMADGLLHRRGRDKRARDCA